MKTLVQFHERTLTALRIWINDLSQREPGGQLIASMLLDDIEQTLVLTKGSPRQAILDQSCEPSLHWWQYDRDYWISYVVREKG